MAIDLSILNDSVTAFMDVGATIVSRTDVLIGLAMIGIVIFIAKKMGNGFGEMFAKFTSGKTGK